MSYNTKLVLPMETGLDFIRTWGEAQEIEYSSNEPREIRKANKSFRIEFITDAEFKKIQLECAITDD